MDQIIPIHIPTKSYSVSETEIKNQPPRPTFDPSVSMIDSFTQLPTPLHLPLLYSEPEPGPVNYFGTLNHLEGDDHVYDQVAVDTVDHSVGLGLGLEPTLGIGIEGDQRLYDHHDKVSLLFSGVDPYSINPNTNTHFDTSSPIDQFSHTDTPLHQLDLYSPINQFSHTEYTLQPPPSLPTNLDQPLFLPEVIETFPYTFDTQAPQPDQLDVSPTGHWTPIASTSHLPPDLEYIYDPFPPSQTVQVPQYLQDHTPTLAPHYPDYELDPDFEMTNDPFQSQYNCDQVYVTLSKQWLMDRRTVTPISTTDHRPIVSCRPTMKFSLPSALGDSVHDPETFGLKAGAVADTRFPPPPGQRYWNTHLPSPTIPVSSWRDDRPTSILPIPQSYRKDQHDQVWSNGGGGGSSKSRIHSSAIADRELPQCFESRPLVHSGQNRREYGDESSINGFSRRPQQVLDINYDPIIRLDSRSLVPQKIHPRPIHTHPPSLAPHHFLSSVSQPPPHTYNPTPSSKLTTDYYPPTPITSYPQPDNPMLPGVHHLFDHHPQLDSHAHTASLSTIFPNAKQYHQPTDDHNRQVPLDQFIRQTESLTRFTRLEPRHHTGVNGLNTRKIGGSDSPGHISIDDDDDDDEISRTSSESEQSFESEEGEGGDTEEVLSEYKPGKNKTTSKSKNKSKIKKTDKDAKRSGSKGKDQSRSSEKRQEVNVLKGLKQHSESVMKEMETRRRNEHKVPLKPAGKSMAGYEFIWEGGIAYTDDAELKQTREVSHSCFPSTSPLVHILFQDCSIIDLCHYSPLTRS